jgi:hypothetical protein
MTWFNNTRDVPVREHDYVFVGRNHLKCMTCGAEKGPAQPDLVDCLEEVQRNILRFAKNA